MLLRRPFARTAAALAATAAILLLTVPPTQAQQLPQTGAEQVGWERHTSHEELRDFLFEVQALTDNMLVRELTTTWEGRTMFLVVLGDPPAATPGDALRSGKPTLLIGNNVHGGELSGREGGLLFLRDLALGHLKPLLQQVNVLIIPSINPDGAAARQRTNSHGYDMNRDYLVLETPEISALVEQVLLEWWPEVHVDTHNGGSRPYNLTYQATLHPAADRDLVALANGPMFERVKAQLEAEGMMLYWYSGPRQDQTTGEWTWTTTDPNLRKQHSYSGFQNMVALLFECPGGDLQTQARAQRAGEEGILRYVAENAQTLMRTVRQARDRTANMTGDQVVIGWERSTYPGTDQFYVIERDPDAPRGAGGEPKLVTGTRSTLYVPSATRERPWAYAFDGIHHDVAALLRRHRIQVEKLVEPVTLTVETYQVTEATWQERPYQTHHLAEIAVEVVEREVTLEAGTYVVRMAQNGANVASYMLEPDTDDSVVMWNFMDPFIRVVQPPAAGDPARAMPEGMAQRPQREPATLPIYRILNRIGIKAVLLP